MDVDAQSGKRPPLMVADVGNSRIKVATWESASDSVPTYFGSFSQDELAAQDWSAVVRRDYPAQPKASRHRGIGGYWIDGITAQNRSRWSGGRI